MLEATLYERNAFVTLTYRDSELPKTTATPSFPQLPTLDPEHLKNWLKRFRAAISPSKIRFYGVGEYGDDTQRPHYHVAVFNQPNCGRGNTIYTSRSDEARPACCDQCRLVHDTWGHGRIFVGDLTIDSAQYVAGYVTKKLTSKEDIRLNGRHPEFSRQSNRGGGIGAGMMPYVADTLREFNLAENGADVPSALRQGSRIMPLGRYLRRKLRKEVGMEENAPEVTLEENKARLQGLRETAFDSSTPLKEAIVKAADNKVLQMETRNKIFKQRKKL